MKALGQIFDFILNAFAVVSGVILVTMMLATVVKIGMRLFLNHGILGIDQISGVMMVYMTFLGAAWVLRNDGHVTVDIVTGALAEGPRRVVLIIGSLIGAFACLLVAYFSAQTVAISLARGVMVAAELEIPRAVNLVVIPLGSFLLGIEFIRRAMRFYRGDVVASELPRMEA
ncbi:TRAP transporter small permease [Devosia limi]|uniref:TRAP transporter small permease protein n=1 Tax=Devosia limi DSM 17137 TaxID=1121477 RepID=A0A1M4WVZ3_9HYPH|nr:TRAP transporter small permease subunit [Devosia limi]SHE85233.1 TRAP-type C4-dicarboxylate transport system, small permease component [Devosia limi DSM 17137]